MIHKIFCTCFHCCTKWRCWSGQISDDAQQCAHWKHWSQTWRKTLHISQRSNRWNIGIYRWILASNFHLEHTGTLITECVTRKQWGRYTGRRCGLTGPPVPSHNSDLDICHQIVYMKDNFRIFFNILKTAICKLSEHKHGSPNSTTFTMWSVTDMLQALQFVALLCALSTQRARCIKPSVTKKITAMSATAGKTKNMCSSVWEWCHRTGCVVKQIYPSLLSLFSVNTTSEGRKLRILMPNLLYLPTKHYIQWWNQFHCGLFHYVCVNENLFPKHRLWILPRLLKV